MKIMPTFCIIAFLSVLLLLSLHSFQQSLTGELSKLTEEMSRNLEQGIAQRPITRNCSRDLAMDFPYCPMNRHRGIVQLLGPRSYSRALGCWKCLKLALDDLWKQNFQKFIIYYLLFVSVNQRESYVKPFFCP